MMRRSGAFVQGHGRDEQTVQEGADLLVVIVVAIVVMIAVVVFVSAAMVAPGRAAAAAAGDTAPPPHLEFGSLGPDPLPRPGFGHLGAAAVRLAREDDCR